jgi:hypothetical protein
MGGSCIRQKGEEQVVAKILFMIGKKIFGQHSFCFFRSIYIVMGVISPSERQKEVNYWQMVSLS